ncbi:EamA family transporter [Anderseniella sp. Alg231-50]|uniref:EamA family transporter n=1 Tax=Anderseniella sp. Alg231-50 TaxID=1922226 RepID=UPI000D55AB7B
MFWLLGIIWGSSFIYMKMASQLVSPMQIVLLRVVFGLVPIALYAQYKGAFKRAHVKHAGHLAVMAVVGTIAYYYGFAKGSSLLLSGVAGALSGLTPILSFLLALMFLGGEKASAFRVLGIVIGFLGVLLIAQPSGTDIAATNIEGVLYNVVGSFSVGASFVYAKKYVIPLGIPVSALITYQLGLSLVILLVVTDMNGIGEIWSNAYVAAGLILGLGVLGTGIAFIIYYYIIDELGAVSAASVAYIPPVVAIIIGVFLVGEKIDLREYLGAALILVGVALVNRKQAVRTATTHGK